MGKIGTGREQGACLAQIRTDRTFGAVKILVDHAAGALVATRQPFPVIAIDAIRLDREHWVDAVFLAQIEIILAMIRRHMHQPGTGIGGDKMRTIEKRARFGVKFAVREFVGHRVFGGSTGELGAFATPATGIEPH